MPARARPRRIAASHTPEQAPWHASRYVRFGALGVVAAAGAVTIALVVGSRGAPSPRGDGPGIAGTVGPIALSASGLEARVAGLDQTVYWIGPVAGYTYELTRTATKAVFIRYLPPGVKAGTREGEELVIATYPYKGALAAVKAVDHGHPLTVAGGKGGIATVERGKSTNVRVAFPHVNYQIEVYSASPQGARQVATSASLKPVP